MLSLVHLSGSQWKPDVKSFTDATGSIPDTGALGICTCVDHCDCENNCIGSHRTKSLKLIIPFSRHIISILCKEHMQLEMLV